MSFPPKRTILRASIALAEASLPGPKTGLDFAYKTLMRLSGDFVYPMLMASGRRIWNRPGGL